MEGECIVAGWRSFLASLSTLIEYTSFRHLNLFNLAIFYMHYTLVLLYLRLIGYLPLPMVKDRKAQKLREAHPMLPPEPLATASPSVQRLRP